MPNYELVINDAGTPIGIFCHDCGKTSWNPNDVQLKYCGNCHVFHEQIALFAKPEGAPRHGFQPGFDLTPEGGDTDG